jgi:hypothetical protein
VLERQGDPSALQVGVDPRITEVHAVQLATGVEAIEEGRLGSGAEHRLIYEVTLTVSGSTISFVRICDALANPGDLVAGFASRSHCATTAEASNGLTKTNR